MLYSLPAAKIKEGHAAKKEKTRGMGNRFKARNGSERRPHERTAPNEIQAGLKVMPDRKILINSDYRPAKRKEPGSAELKGVLLKNRPSDWHTW